jgi:GTP cyclohydrolase I
MSKPSADKITVISDHNHGLEQAYTKILTDIGEDTKREGLIDTPKRAAKAIRYLTGGYEQSLDDVINGAVFSSDNDNMVLVKNIEFFSQCEHHMLPFLGYCHVAYYPNGKVLGLSKLARIVDMYARRLQIQENLSKQIADAINDILKPRGVAVQMTAIHMCMMMRGVEKHSSETTTSALVGEFKSSEAARQEFLQQIGPHNKPIFG